MKARIINTRNTNWVAGKMWQQNSVLKQEKGQGVVGEKGKDTVLPNLLNLWKPQIGNSSVTSAL